MNFRPVRGRALSSPSILKPSRWSWVKQWDSMFSAGLERAIESGDEFNSQLNAAELAVALRRFRLDRGAYPDDLSALVPGYLARDRSTRSPAARPSTRAKAPDSSCTRRGRGIAIAKPHRIF